MSKTIVTHDGKFHADDVFSVALLKRIYGDATISRTRKAEDIGRADVVVDVGGVYDEALGRFDHHQKGGAATRENGIPYASFGLVWRAYGEKLCTDASVARRVEEVLVLSIDANDNGVDLSTPTIADVSGYELSDAIRAFVPTWQEDESVLEGLFADAVAFASHIIEREIIRAEAFVAGERAVRSAYEKASDKSLVILDEDYSWKSILAKLPEPLYVIHPQNGTWRLCSVRDNPHQFENRKDLPEAWAGLRDEALASVTGVFDAVFCHRNRFMAVARTREGVLALAKKALNG
ncbi:MAG: metal-dependent hydrolase [Candidatus Taylorbacteria bacterium CG11_big_fil_rev_8_21_14_0_20_46_11]|uniref:Metal-dependent hydrolase n=1 Tax=Candidatus Taylorbacteria bacterium CG11_big_fil_rev_8_21_14_0_20_46_11 TaxID=1975025 RepID=A0A2H0KA13_9BACT|nr:MAG: metal-dependent hydrolase [Candidatus Taylorbacteria bacterium CG11_big_fil_rev_8_21_14_0_20_46_11]